VTALRVVVVDLVGRGSGDHRVNQEADEASDQHEGRPQEAGAIPLEGVDPDGYGAARPEQDAEDQEGVTGHGRQTTARANRFLLDTGATNTISLPTA